MKSIQGRLSKLEHWFGIADDTGRFIVTGQEARGR